MKNIRNYCPEKYNESDYKKVKDNIYVTIQQSSYIFDYSLALKGLDDEELTNMFFGMKWKKCDTEIEDDYLYLIYG